MIRDIKINYGELKRLLYQMNRYRKALVQMGDSVAIIQNVLRKNKGFVITSLVEQAAEIGREIKSIKDEVDSIYNIVNGYVTDMTRIIAPVRESQMMQVDRNDIYWNKESINGLCDSVSAIPKNITTYGDFDFWPFDEDEEEQERRRRNDEKLSEIRAILSNSYKLFDVYKEEMNELYKVVQKYENMDDTYSKKAKDLKWDNTSFAEGLEDVGKGAKKAVTDFVEGVVEGAVDLVKGIGDTAGGVLKYDGAFIATAYGEVTGTDIPDSREKYYEEKSEMANAFLEDPSLMGEGIAQQISDGVEEKGVAYSVGYAAPVVASFVVGDKGTSKASNVGKVTKVTSKLDDVANVLNKTSKADDVVNGVNKVSKVDDVINGVNKASKADDILNEGSKVADDVARVPKREIVKDVGEGCSDVWDMTEGGGIINGREYSQHAMERMAPDTPSVRAELSRRAEAHAESKGLQVGIPEYYQFCQKYVDPRNIPPSVIEDAIRNTTAVPGHTAGTFVHQTVDVTVIVNETGKVITVIPK